MGDTELVFKDVSSRSYCYSGYILHKKNDRNLFTSDLKFVWYHNCSIT